MLYNDSGVVVGASYADVHVELPALWLLIVLAAVAGIAAWVNVRLRTLRLLIAAPLLVFGGSLLFAEVIPGLFERFFVKPNELQLETPYLQRSIAFTREAYNLGQIAVKPFPAEQDLTFQSLKDNSGTIDNIRLWDARGARARPFAAVGQRPNLGQPPSSVHPRRRSGDVPGHPEVR